MLAPIQPPASAAALAPPAAVPASPNRALFLSPSPAPSLALVWWSAGTERRAGMQLAAPRPSAQPPAQLSAHRPCRLACIWNGSACCSPTRCPAQPLLCHHSWVELSKSLKYMRIRQNLLFSSPDKENSWSFTLLLAAKYRSVREQITPKNFYATKS